MMLAEKNTRKIAGLDPADVSPLQKEIVEEGLANGMVALKMTPKEGAKHMALKFTRLAGEFSCSKSENDNERIIAEIFSGSMVAAEILSADLSHYNNEIFETRKGELPRATVICAGKMAEACEKLDHLEDYPFRETLLEQAVHLAAIAISYAELRKMDMKYLVEKYRW